MSSNLAPRGLEPHYDWFARVVVECLPSGGCAIDVGAGGGLPKALTPIRAQAGKLVGIDPSPLVLAHPDLDERFQMPLEEVDLPPACADVLYAYNVVEHIPRPEPFLKKAYDLLRPDGYFVFLTPNSAHPFALLARSMEQVGLKPLMRRMVARQRDGSYAVNDYPAYYRMNRGGTARRLAGKVGFRQIETFHFPSGWKHYFPRPLWGIPRTYDILTRNYFPSGQLLFAALLRK